MSTETQTPRQTAQADGSITTLHHNTGTCSKAVEVTTRDGVVERVQFYGGCAGNTRGIQQLVAGMPVDDVIRRLRGTQCGARGTSCPDQLALALEENRQEAATRHAGGSAVRGIMALLMALLMLGACTESFAERCRREAAEFTAKQCPYSVVTDGIVVCDSMAYTSTPAGFTYYYHVSDILDSPDAFTSETAGGLRGMMLESLQQNITLKAYKERGMCFTYTFLSGSTGATLFEVVFTPDDYNTAHAPSR